MITCIIYIKYQLIKKMNKSYIKLTPQQLQRFVDSLK